MRVSEAVVDIDSKPCRKCGEAKPLSEFYEHSQMLDGHLHTCKACARALARHNRQCKLDYYQAYDRLRAFEGPDRCKTQRTNSAEAREAWRLKNLHKCAAQKKVHRAIRDGKMARPSSCSNCGVVGPIHAHHHDYARPLEVEWLCRRCHGSAHRRYPVEETRARVARGVA